MNYYLLTYVGSENYIEARAPYRKPHLELAWEYVEKGALILGGAYEEPADGALLVFYVSDPKIIEEFVKKDPYVINGVVKSWKIRKWKCVVGKDCQTPVHPHQL